MSVHESEEDFEKGFRGAEIREEERGWLKSLAEGRERG